MAVLSDDMGGITAYAAAVNRGYTGTKEEFEQLMYSYTEVAERAEAAAGNAHESEEASIEAKDIAVSAKNEAVSARDAAVSARDASIAAKNDSESARDASISAKNDTLAAKDAVMSAKGSVDETSANFSDAVTAAISDVNAAGRNQKELAKTHAIDSEAWAVGQREGADVGVSDETYHNNSKYYAEQSALAKSETETARDTAITAKNGAVSAKNEAETAKGQAQDIVDGINAKSEQIDQNAEDISALQTAISTKAEIDGYYADLVSGGSTQLLSDMVATDAVPYNYRTAGGSLEIGDRMKLKKIVGGSLAVNQLVTDPNFTDGTKWNSIARAYATVSVSNNEITMTVVETVSANGIININSTVPNRAGHKLLFSAYVNPSKSVNVRIGASGIPAAGDYGLDSSPVAASTWTLMEKIGSCQSGNTASSLNLYLDVGSALTEGDTVKVKNFVCFDLTAMFGSTIADYIYALEQATAGAGVAWLKSHFPRIFNAGYVPYNAGTLEHVSGLSAHKMTGFNQWDEEWENGRFNVSTGEKSSGNGLASKNKIRVLPNTTYYATCGSGYGSTLVLFYYDASENFISYEVKYSLTTPFTTPNDACYMNINLQTSSAVTAYNHDICINLHWDGELDGEYEPYEEHSYPLDSDVTLCGIPKLDANNNLYYDGDRYLPDGTVERRYGIVDLGTLNWSYNATSGAERFISSGISSIVKKPSASNINANIMSSMYRISNASHYIEYDKTICVYTDGDVGIRNTTYTDKDTFKTAMSGVYLVYELATPTTEEADPYTEIQNVSNWGTEEFVTTSLVPVGHETAYQPDLRAKIEVAPESPDTDGLYLMKRENGQNNYVAYLGELPSDPTTDGTYTLKCTVSGGTSTKTWEADE